MSRHRTTQTPDSNPLVVAARGGDELDSAITAVYNELRRLAAHYLRAERVNHTLQPTALVNEAYVCLAGQESFRWNNRAHFLAIAAKTMRRILVDHARRHGATKRGGSRIRVSLSGVEQTVKNDPREDLDVVALDSALQKFADFDLQKARIVELRYFGGLTVEETAEVLDISPATVKRMWSLAKAWLHRELAEPGRKSQE